MEYVEGRIFKDRTLSGLTKQERKDIYSELINVLVKIHSVDISASGLNWSALS
jgi:aminoglycoside phosphotransferase (APT) family kinase protein